MPILAFYYFFFNQFMPTSVSFFTSAFRTLKTMNYHEDVKCICTFLTRKTNKYLIAVHLTREEYTSGMDIGHGVHLYPHGQVRRDHFMTITTNEGVSRDAGVNPQAFASWYKLLVRFPCPHSTYITTLHLFTNKDASCCKDVTRAHVSIHSGT